MSDPTLHRMRRAASACAYNLRLIRWEIGRCYGSEAALKLILPYLDDIGALARDQATVAAHYARELLGHRD